MRSFYAYVLVAIVTKPTRRTNSYPELEVCARARIWSRFWVGCQSEHKYFDLRVYHSWYRQQLSLGDDDNGDVGGRDVYARIYPDVSRMDKEALERDRTRTCVCVGNHNVGSVGIGGGMSSG